MTDTRVTSTRFLQGMAILGALVMLAAAAFSPLRAWSNLLVISYLLLTISLGGAVFLALTSICGAGWDVAFRRVPESLARTLPLAGLVMLLTLAIRTQAYGWKPPTTEAGTFWFKEFWLTPWFWLARAATYVVLWSVAARWLVSRSHRQATQTTMSSGLSALFLAIYAVTFPLASIDWMMAIEPMWFSTIWGVYHFAGLFQATLAVVILLALIQRANGAMTTAFRDEHLHDLGKLLLGFSCFWMYIWFSQYMLIWYSNIPEETSYFVARTRGPWGPVVLLLIVLNWVIPFFVLLPRPAKRNAGVMAKVAVAVLIGRWLDLYLIVFPSIRGGEGHSRLFQHPVFGFEEAGALCCLIGVAGLLLSRSFAGTRGQSSSNPLLQESLQYHI